MRRFQLKFVLKVFNIKMKYILTIGIVLVLGVSALAQYRPPHDHSRPPPPPDHDHSRPPPPPDHDHSRRPSPPDHDHTHPPPPPKSKKCDTNEDCDPGQCCLSDFNIFFKKPSCKPLRSEGEHCSKLSIQIKRKYVGHCPCAEGLSCVPESTEESGGGVWNFNSKCTVVTESPVETTEQDIITETEDIVTQ